MFCQYCGEKLADNAAFCSNCGRPLGSLAVRQDPRLMVPDDRGYRMSRTRRVMTRDGLIIEVPVVDEPRIGRYAGMEYDMDGGGMYPSPSYYSGGPRARERRYEDMRDARIDDDHRLPQDRVDGDNRTRNDTESVKRWSANDGIQHRNAGKVRPKKDKDFTKFLEEPLPMRPVKIVIAVLLILMSGFSVFNAIRGGALDVIRTQGATSMGIAGFLLAVVWLIVALIGFTVKYNKGATLTAGILLLFATGVAFTTKDAVPYGMYYAMFSMLSSIVYLISGSGGVSMDGLE